MRKRLSMSLMGLVLTALLGLGLSLTAQASRLTVPLVQLDHDTSRMELSLVACGDPSIPDLPTSATVWSYTDILRESTVTLGWSMANPGCMSTLIGGDVGALTVTLPTGNWDLGYYSQTSEDLWEDQDFSWTRGVIKIDLGVLVGRAVPEAMEIATTGLGVYAVLEITSTVPISYWGNIFVENITGNRIPVAPATQVTVSLPSGYRQIQMVSSENGHPPQEWSCSLSPCPGVLTKFDPLAYGQGVELKDSIPFGCNFEYSWHEGEVWFYTLTGNPRWAQDSWPISGKVIWGDASKSLCAPVVFEDWGLKEWRPDSPHGITFHQTTLVTEPGSWTSPISLLEGPEYCGYRVYMPSAMR